MQFNEKQPQLPPASGQLQTHESRASAGERILPGNLGTQNKPATDDNEEDPVLTEGYLPEIYFSLKSDNPADW